MNGNSMRNKFLFVFSFCLFSIFCSGLYGQQCDTSLKAIYEKEVIYFQDGKYVKDNHQSKISWRDKEFLKLFDSCSEEAKDEIKLARKYDKRSSIFGSASLVFDACGFVIIFGTTPSSLTDVALLISLGGTLTNIVFTNINSSKSARHLEKAIWLRNRDALIRAKMNAKK